MSEGHKIGRRAMCATMLGMGGSLLLANPLPAAERRPRRPAAAPPALKNADFYKDGKFNEQAAKDAYLAMLRQAAYPISDGLVKNLAVTDFALGRFLEVGLGTVVWIGEKKWNYTTLDIFLLPGQIIPEHWHVAMEADGVAAKMESWLVRWGSSYIVGEGEPTANPPVKIPESEAKFLTVKKGKLFKVGEVTGITHPGEKHWQQAGPQGAIVSEVSTYHVGAAVRFTNPGIKF
jgi:D-lyxose ketol-isomerase